MHTVNIKDISKLKFKKVKPWKITFFYEDTLYMILDDSGDERHLSLLKQVTHNGKKTFDYINGIITLYSPMDLIKDISRKKSTKVENITYSNIDREYFVKKLVELGFSSGLFETEYVSKQAEINKLKLRIKELEAQIVNVNKSWDKTSGHGSKCYGLALKKQVADRVVGAKDGDYCEQYNDYYGNSHPEYGGKLVDLFNLTVGTHFYVCNGLYYASIGVNKHGDKTVITDVGERVITSDYHSLYIK